MNTSDNKPSLAAVDAGSGIDEMLRHEASVLRGDIERMLGHLKTAKTGLKSEQERLKRFYAAIAHVEGVQRNHEITIETLTRHIETRRRALLDLEQDSL